LIKNVKVRVLYRVDAAGWHERKPIATRSRRTA
jgi:hypothetical protein